MDTIKDFIVQNWQFISSAILAVLTIIAMLVKKKPQTLDDFVLALHQALMDVPYLKSTVEPVIFLKNHHQNVQLFE